MKKSELKNLVRVSFNQEWFLNNKINLAYMLAGLPENDSGSKSIVNFTEEVDFFSIKVSVYISKENIGKFEEWYREVREEEEKQLKKQKIDTILEDEELLKELMKKLQEKQQTKKK